MVRLDRGPAITIDYQLPIDEVIDGGLRPPEGTAAAKTWDAAAGGATQTIAPHFRARIPVEIRDRISIRYFIPETEGRFHGPALVIRRTDGQLVAAVAAGGGVVEGVFGDGLHFDVSHQIAYTEVRQLPSLCLAAIVHRYLRLRLGKEERTMAPGSYLDFALRGHAYRVVLADVAEPQGDRCAAEAPAHLSFVVLWQGELLQGRARPRPAPGAGAGPASGDAGPSEGR